MVRSCGATFRNHHDGAGRLARRGDLFVREGLIPPNGAGGANYATSGDGFRFRPPGPAVDTTVSSDECGWAGRSSDAEEWRSVRGHSCQPAGATGVGGGSAGPGVNDVRRFGLRGERVCASEAQVVPFRQTAFTARRSN